MSHIQSLATSTLLCAAFLTLAPAAAQNHSGHTMPMPAAKASKVPLPVTISGASIVAVPPVIKETSAFMVLKNTSSQPIKLMNVSATVAGSAMLMKTIKNQNMTGMIPAATLTIPAKGTLTLKNDGDHIMLMTLKRPLKVGEVLPIVLTDAAGRSVTVKATVKKP